MASNNVSLGELIHQVGERNKGLLSTEPLGVSIDKEFMPSVANTIGTDLSKYMLLRRNRFACNPMHVGRDRALPIARYKNDAPGIVSPAYMTFEADESKIDLDYLELFFKLAVFDKECWFYTDSTVRGGLSWDALCSIELNLPSFDDQRKIASIVKVIRERMVRLAEQNDYLAELVSLMFERLIEKCVETVPLSTYVTISSGKRPPTKSPVFTDECVFPLFGASSQMGYTSEYLTDEKLLVIGRVGTHGVVQRVSGKAWPSDNTLVIRSDHYETASQLLQRVDYPSLNRGSTQPLITQGDLKNYEVPRISPVALERFEDQAGQLMSLYDHNCIESAKLIELRDALLPRLMSGELDVSGVTI